MPEAKKAQIILDEIENKELTLKQIKEITGSGTNINNIRKALHKLLINGLIEPCGYDGTCDSFKFDCFTFRLVEPGKNRWNPIYIKSLLDKPQENYHEIREIFRNTIKKINKIYEDEKVAFIDSILKMPLKKALEEGYVNPERVFEVEISIVNDEKINTPITLKEYSIKHPGAMIWYFKKQFITQFAITEKTNKFPYFPIIIIDKDDNGTKDEVLDKVYKLRFMSLPIKHEDYLFKKLVIGAIKDNGEKGDEHRWQLAHKLVLDSDSLILLIKELDFIFDTAVDESFDLPRFFPVKYENIAKE